MPAPPCSRAGRRGRGLFERLLAEGRLAIAPSALFESQPPALQGLVTPDRVRGMLLGLAIGDALGNTSESLWPGQRRLCTGEIRSPPADDNRLATHPPRPAYEAEQLPTLRRSRPLWTGARIPLLCDCARS